MSNNPIRVLLDAWKRGWAQGVADRKAREAAQSAPPSTIQPQSLAADPELILDEAVEALLGGDQQGFSDIFKTYGDVMLFLYTNMEKEDRVKEFMKSHLRQQADLLLVQYFAETDGDGQTKH